MEEVNLKGTEQVGGQQIRPAGRKGAGRGSSRGRWAMSQHLQLLEPPQEFSLKHPTSTARTLSGPLISCSQWGLHWELHTHSARALCTAKTCYFSQVQKCWGGNVPLQPPPAPAGVIWNRMLSSIRWILNISKNGDSIESFHLQIHN